MRYLLAVPLALVAAALIGLLAAVVAHLLSDATGPLVYVRCGRQVRYGRAGCPCRLGRAARGSR